MRVLVLLLAFLAFGAHAKTATLKGTTTNTCIFSDTLVSGGGDLTVTCVAPPAPPPSTCAPYGGPVASLNGPGFVNHLYGRSPYSVVYALPVSPNGFGIFSLYSNPQTPSFGPTKTEVKISRCKGDFTDDADGCYQVSGALINQQITGYWAPRFTARYPDQASFIANKRCLTAAPGPWYINVRMSYPAGSCPTGQCGWDPIWKIGSSF